MSNLINKLTQIKMQTAKRVGAIALAGALVFGTAAGCANTVDPSISATQEENGKYSNLLMSVVHDEYYKSLVNNEDRADYEKPAYDPHPYAFLEDAGIDTDKILDGTYRANTISYVLDDEPNNLYINTKVLIDDSYWHSFLLTYQLNDKEMADYMSMHGANESSYTYYWPAFFMNDKISETREPTNVQETKYTKSTQIGLDSYHVRDTQRGYIIPKIAPEADGYSLILYDNKSHNGISLTTNKIIIAQLSCSYLENYPNNIVDITEPSRFTVETKEEKTGTFLTTQNCSLGNRSELELDQ